MAIADQTFIIQTEGEGIIEMSVELSSADPATVAMMEQAKSYIDTIDASIGQKHTDIALFNEAIMSTEQTFTDSDNVERLTWQAMEDFADASNFAALNTASTTHGSRISTLEASQVGTAADLVLLDGIHSVYNTRLSSLETASGARIVDIDALSAELGIHTDKLAAAELVADQTTIDVVDLEAIAANLQPRMTNAEITYAEHNVLLEGLELERQSHDSRIELVEVATNVEAQTAKFVELEAGIADNATAITSHTHDEYATSAQGDRADTALQALPTIVLNDLDNVSGAPTDGQALVYTTIGGWVPATSDREPAISKRTGFNKDFGVIADTVVQGNDPRMSDARAPTAHSHSDYVDVSSTQSVSGVKTYTHNMFLEGGYLAIKNTNVAYLLMDTENPVSSARLNMRREGVNEGKLESYSTFLRLSRMAPVADNMITLFDDYTQFSKVVRGQTPVDSSDLVTKSYADDKFFDMAGGDIIGNLQVLQDFTVGDGTPTNENPIIAIRNGPAGNGYLRFYDEGVLSGHIRNFGDRIEVKKEGGAYQLLYDDRIVVNKVIQGIDPAASNHLTTRAYVDAADTLKLSLTGGTVAGHLIANRFYAASGDSGIFTDKFRSNGAASIYTASPLQYASSVITAFGTTPPGDGTLIHKKYVGDNFVDKTTDQIIAGVKTFSANPFISGSAPRLTLNGSGTASTTQINFEDSDTANGQLIANNARMLLRRVDNGAGNNDFSIYDTYSQFDKVVIGVSPTAGNHLTTKDYVDAAIIAGGGGGGGSISDHGLLTGLADDDHTQYHNDTRGDVRYYSKAAADANFVSLTGNQDIAGDKTFTQQVFIDNPIGNGFLTVAGSSGNNAYLEMKANDTRRFLISAFETSTSISHENGASDSIITMQNDSIDFNKPARGVAPVNVADFTRKDYVDDNFVADTGGTMSGDLYAANIIAQGTTGMKTDKLRSNGAVSIYTASPMQYATVVVNEFDTTAPVAGTLIHKGWLDDNFVDLATNQNIAGLKTFSSDLTINKPSGNGLLLFQVASALSGYVGSIGEGTMRIKNYNASGDNQMDMFSSNTTFQKDVRVTTMGTDGSSVTTKSFVDANFLNKITGGVVANDIKVDRGGAQARFITSSTGTNLNGFKMDQDGLVRGLLYCAGTDKIRLRYYNNPAVNFSPGSELTLADGYADFDTVLRASTPVGDGDLTTKAYVDTAVSSVGFDGGTIYSDMTIDNQVPVLNLRATAGFESKLLFSDNANGTNFEIAAYKSGGVSRGKFTLGACSITMYETNVNFDKDVYAPNLGSISSRDIWQGTQAQYDALGTYDNNTLYFVE